MEHSTDEVSGACKSKRIQEMHRRVCQIKASEKTEVKYMQTWEERILLKQEGEREHLKNQIKKKLEKNLSEEQIAEMLETDIAEVKQIMNEIQNKESVPD